VGKIAFDRIAAQHLPARHGTPILGDGVSRNDPWYAAGWDERTWSCGAGANAIPDTDSWGAVYIGNGGGANTRPLIITDVLLLGTEPADASQLVVQMHTNITVVDDANFDALAAVPMSPGRSDGSGDPDPVLANATLLFGNAAGSMWSVVNAMSFGWELPVNRPLARPLIIKPGAHVGFAVVNATGAPANADVQILFIEVP
tara:strand:- start:22 stop:624 length:603 start_codon:yes stop_codon:yes gene_type:complete